MSGENVEAAKRLRELWLTGGFDAVRDLIAEDVLVTDVRAAPDAPRVVRGRDAMEAAFAGYDEVFDDFVREVDEYVEAGDWVIVVGRWVGTAKLSGARVEDRSVNAACVRGGKLVEWILSLPDKEAALEAVRRRERETT